MQALNGRKTLIAAVAATLLSPMAAQAQEAGDWMLRGRAILITPDESADISIGGDINVSNEVTPEFDITYFVTPNFAFELIAATAEHNLSATGTALGDVDLGSSWVVPPTLLAQYHFRAGDKFKPYLGAGLNYTFFFDGDDSDVGDVDLTNEFGFALQAGVDIDISDNWVFNLDVKRYWLNTDADIADGAATADVDVDPWIFGVGFGYKF